MVKRPPSVPDRGEIWHLNFAPSTCRKMLSEHYCLVLSKREFNDSFGLALVCPVSQDWPARKASFKEKAPTDIVQHVLACIGAVGRVEWDMMVKNEYMAVVT